MERHIKNEKWKDFIIDFKNNPEKWSKSQIEDDWEFDEETQLKIIENIFYTKIGLAIKYIKNPTKKVCFKAVKNDGWAIKYIENPTEEMCLEAVKQDGTAIQFIKNPQEYLCLMAIKKYGSTIQYIDNPSEEVCLKAVKQNGYFICYILKKNQSFDIVQAFFDFDWSKSEYSREDCYEYLAKKFITKDQALIMIQDDPKYINFVSKKIQRDLIEMKPELEKYLNKKENEDNINDFFD